MNHAGATLDLSMNEREMSETLQKLKKLRGRSLDEWRVRGSQMIRARAEARGWSRLMRVPDDESFFKLINAIRLEDRSVNAVSLLIHFRERSSPGFFAGLRDRDETVRELRRRFDRSAEEKVVERARRIREGHFNLLGLNNLDFGSPPDFHLEPTSGSRSPLIHWSLFDELGGDLAVDKKIVWELNRCQYFKTLGRAYWWTRDEGYAETFVAHLDAWMEQNPPGRGINWVSSLEVALRAISWLWALYFFRDSKALTPPLFLRALKYLHLHGRHLETYLSTYSSPNTHLTGEALGLFYLGTLLPELQCTARWRETGERILMAELQRRHVRPDGVYFEQSSYYQRYTSDFYTHLYILKQINGDAIAPELEEKLTALLDHLMYITCPDGTTPFYGDDDGGRLVILDERERNDFRATLSTGASLFARPRYKFVAGEVAEETFWLLGREGLRGFDELDALPPTATSRAFNDGGYYVMRDGWTRRSNYMLIDCGPHGMLNCGHAHADALSFVAAARGRTLLVDPGTFTYTGSKESRDYFRSSLAHNTLAVDGESSSVPDGPFNWKHIAEARVRAWESQKRFDFFEGTHDGYARLSSPAVHVRSLLFLKNDYWVLRDRVETTGAHRYELRFHFAPDADPTLESNDEVEAVRASRLDAPGLALFGFATDGGGAWHKEEGWVSRCYGAREAATTCCFSTEAEGAQEFVTFLVPRGAGEDVVRVREIKAEGGRAFEVTDGDRRDLLLLRRAGGRVVEAAQVSSDCDWAWLRFARAESGELSGSVTELLLVGGRALLINGQELFKATEPIAFEYVQWDGTKLRSKDREYVRN